MTKSSSGSSAAASTPSRTAPTSAATTGGFCTITPDGRRRRMNAAVRSALTSHLSGTSGLLVNGGQKYRLVSAPRAPAISSDRPSMAVHAMNALADGLLIVNADDLGYDAPTTDAILESFRRGAITSATAMMHMADSERAARLARESGIPAGLHLNLIEPFTGAAVPPRVREDQERLCGHFASKHRLRWLYDPRIRGLLRRTIEDQLNEFERLYGGLPTHFDGHRHMHLSLNVVLGRTPLSPLPARRSFSY